MPTRYALELESLKGAVTAETLKEESQRLDAKKNVKKVFEQKFSAGQNKWFFTPLRVSGGSPVPFRRTLYHTLTKCPRLFSLFPASPQTLNQF